MKFLVTGGAGFIGSAFIRLLLADGPEKPSVLNLDKLTYAGNLENLASLADDPCYRFVQGDICDLELVNNLLAETQPDVIVNFAAESHVDRSILSPNRYLKPICAAPLPCLKRRALLKRADSCTFRPTKFTVAWSRPMKRTKIFRFARRALIQLRRPAPTCWRFLISSPTACR